MIICHCNVITDTEIKQAAKEILSAPNRSVCTPGAIFRQLGKKPNCGGCFNSIIEIIVKQMEEESEAGQ
ncbi:(2Fe-2S)-binding protein [Polycladidibacter stylochi]|uniref:(2Fe-2S)-binding protein n=1 Tax=Polycladidibacter stylochi TaxID=1807766 RepID=UPI0008372637